MIRREVRLAYLVDWMLKQLPKYKTKVGIKRYTALVKALKIERAQEDLQAFLVNGKLYTINMEVRSEQ